MADDSTLLGRMRTGTAVLGDVQRLPGYSLLIYEEEAGQLNDLPQPERVAFLADLALLGEAVERACSALDPEFWRINYSVYGNSWEHLHGHVFARYRWEEETLRRGPVWRYPDLRDERYALGERHAALRAAVAAALAEVVAEDAAGPG
ncbi:hypothetical protein GCM10009678_37100 [Actinomadura kijaniata]|uniref:Diadenosine tetraphosphate (Ap4A) HIT family hydrolase n=1 Tax=Actinomadura namibiensis TaxID=182080 RepID=A0A7W3LZF4_ACTNM|nr:HIT domain-containing protein [Actinomadura namibiensis]MBA8957126.1 diadenosine tetraphosphate (Ap4A) HIT family hydrolase [Actinomadura namibiensis]